MISIPSFHLALVSYHIELYNLNISARHRIITNQHRRTNHSRKLQSVPSHHRWNKVILWTSKLTPLLSAVWPRARSVPVWSTAPSGGCRSLCWIFYLFVPWMHERCPQRRRPAGPAGQRSLSSCMQMTIMGRIEAPDLLFHDLFFPPSFSINKWISACFGLLCFFVRLWFFLSGPGSPSCRMRWC